MQTLSDGIVLYQHPDNLTEVTLNGVSVLNLLIEEVRVAPDGWGYILCEKELGRSGVPVKVWVDGQTRNHQYWGTIVVTP